MSEEIFMSIQDERLHQTEMIVKRQIERVQNILDEQMSKTAGLIEKQMERARSFLNQKHTEHNIIKSSYSSAEASRNNDTDSSAEASRNNDTDESSYQSTSDKIKCQKEFEDIIDNGLDQTKRDIHRVVLVCSYCGSDLTQIKEDIQNADTIGERLVQDPRYQTESTREQTVIDSHDNDIAWRRVGRTHSPAVANTQNQESVNEKHQHAAISCIRLNPSDKNNDPSQYDSTDQNIIQDDTRQSAIVSTSFRRLTYDRQHDREQAIQTMYAREARVANSSNHNNNMGRSLRVVEREVAISASTTCSKSGLQLACTHNKHTRKSRHKSKYDAPLTLDVDRICSADSRRRKFASQKSVRMINVTRVLDTNCRVSNTKQRSQERGPSHIRNDVAESLRDTQDIRIILDTESCIRRLGLESQPTTKIMLVEDATSSDVTNRVLDAASVCSSDIEVEVPKSTFASRYEHTIIEDETVETKSEFKYNSDDITQSVDTVYINATMNSENSKTIRHEVEIDDVVVRQTAECEQIAYCSPVVNVLSEVIGEELNTDNNNIAYAGRHNTYMFDVVVSETVPASDCDRDMDVRPTLICIVPDTAPLDCAHRMDDRPVVDVVIVPETSSSDLETEIDDSPAVDGVIVLDNAFLGCPHEMDDRPVVDEVIVPETAPLICAHGMGNKPDVNVLTVPDTVSLDCAHGMDDISAVDVVVPETEPQLGCDARSVLDVDTGSETATLDYEHELDARPVLIRDATESAPVCCELQTNATSVFEVEIVPINAPVLRCELETDAIAVIDVVVSDMAPLDREREVDCKLALDVVVPDATTLNWEREMDVKPILDVNVSETATWDCELEIDATHALDVVVPNTAPLDFEREADDVLEISILYGERQKDTKSTNHTTTPINQVDSRNHEDGLIDPVIFPEGVPSLSFRSDEELYPIKQREYIKEVNGEVDVATTVNIVADKEINVIEDSCSKINREKGQYIIQISNTDNNEVQAYTSNTTSKLHYRTTSKRNVDTIQVIDNVSLTQTANTLGDSILSLEDDGLDKTYIRNGHGKLPVRVSFTKQDTERQQQQSGEAGETTSRATESNGPKYDIGNKVTNPDTDTRSMHEKGTNIDATSTTIVANYVTYDASEDGHMNDITVQKICSEADNSYTMKNTYTDMTRIADSIDNSYTMENMYTDMTRIADSLDNSYTMENTYTDMTRIADSILLEEVDSSFYERAQNTDRHSISSNQLSLKYEDTDQYSFTGVSWAVDRHGDDSEQPPEAPLDYYTDISVSSGLSQSLHYFSDIVNIKSYNFGDDQLSEPVMQTLRRNRKIKRLHRKRTTINSINLKYKHTGTSISKSYRSSHSNVRLGGLGSSSVDSGSLSKGAPGRPIEFRPDTYIDEDIHNGDDEASTTVNSSILQDDLGNLTDVEDSFTPDNNESSNTTDLLGTSSDTFTRIENPDYRH